MKTCIILLVCLSVAFAAKSKLRELKKDRQRRAACTGNAITNCEAYGHDICTNPDYVKWAQENCCTFCGLGGSTSTGTGGGDGGFQLIFATQPPVSSGGTCADVISNCADYTTSVCSNADYADWVGKNCAKFCNKCGSMGAPMPPMNTGGVMTGGSCHDAIANCDSYGSAVCSSPDYTQWVHQNCQAFCGQCGSGTHTGTGTGTMTGGTMTGGTMTGTGGTMTGTGGTMTGTGGTMTGTGGTMTGTGGTMTGTGGTMTGGTCVDAIPTCADYTTSVCSDPKFADWVSKNCQKFCNQCSSGTMTGGTMTGGTMTGTGGTMTGTGTGTMTGGTMTGTCGDVTANCAMLDQASHICSDQAARVFAAQNCAKTCNLCGGTMTGGTMTGGTMTGGTGGTMTGGTMTGGTGGTMTGGTMTGACADTIANCDAYGATVCTDPNYADWVGKNCNKFCNKCSSGTMTGGTMTGGTMTGGTGTGTGGTMTGSSSGCVYGGQVYSQGQTWKDGCKFTCSCSDASTGKYQCTQMCVNWDLPAQCTMNPPAAGKCCPTPNCPAGFTVQYPPGYVEQ